MRQKNNNNNVYNFFFTFFFFLCCHLDRVGEGPGPNAGVGLHPDGVDGVGRQVADGGQLVVVHELGLPLGQRQLRVRAVVHLQHQQH